MGVQKQKKRKKIRQEATMVEIGERNENEKADT